MSDCRMCDTCGTVFSVLDLDARRITVEEPLIENGTARGVQTVCRDLCSGCFKAMNTGARNPVAQLTGADEQ